MTAIALPAAPDRYRFKYLIAITVSLASVLELLDTSIVNVAIPHMMGNLGATLDQIAWVSTGYIVANVIVLPITGWLSAFFGRRRYFAGSIALFRSESRRDARSDRLGLDRLHRRQRNRAPDHRVAVGVLRTASVLRRIDRALPI